MIKPGHLRITDKVYFEYYEMAEPKPDDFDTSPRILKSFEEIFELKLSTKNPGYKIATVRYEASKRTIEVSNVKKAKTIWIYKYRCGYKALAGKMVINNSPCKAEVTDKATIIELTKEF